MSDRERNRTASSEDIEGRDETRGAPGTTRGRAGTAGTEGQNVPRRDREPSDGRVPHRPSEEGSGAQREHGDTPGSEEGIAGEGPGQSGTVEGSMGGTTGTAGHSGGTQAPGATDPGFPGMSADEAERRRREGRRRRDG